jgi:hypothetical protein
MITKMKKTLLIAILSCLAFAGCSKDDGDQKKITNLSGTVWYDTYVWFNSEDGTPIGFDGPLGTVEIGESITVSTSHKYFSINFNNASGKLISTQNKSFAGGSVSVREDDLL